MAIRSFKDKKTENLFYEGSYGKGLGIDIAKQAVRKLDMLNAAKDIRDLRVPPKNNLKALERDLSGYWSIRINDQFRIVFRWENGGAEDVHITDYH
jgi:proteic killer suppression protein